MHVTSVNQNSVGSLRPNECFETLARLLPDSSGRSLVYENRRKTAREAVTRNLPADHRLGETGRLGHDFVGLRYPDDLFDRCLTFKHAPPTILAEGEHALGN